MSQLQYRDPVGEPVRPTRKLRARGEDWGIYYVCLLCRLAAISGSDLAVNGCPTIHGAYVRTFADSIVPRFFEGESPATTSGDYVRLLKTTENTHRGGGGAHRPIRISQDCKNGCGMKVVTLLEPGMVIPEPRECVVCARLSA